jgi:tRNA pseudouridine32 synthase / 23S rRNA pseudouridine746 synthase
MSGTLKIKFLVIGKLLSDMDDPIVPRNADDEGEEGTYKTSRMPPLPEDLEIGILFRNEELVIVDKPYDLRIDGKGFSHTLEKFVRAKIPMDKFRLVHQLDFATSGVLTLGLTRKGAGKAGMLFRRRHTEKYYVAVGVGHWSRGEVGVPVLVDEPIAEVEGDFRMSAEGEGKESRTVVLPLMNTTTLPLAQRGEQPLLEEDVTNLPVCLFLLKPISGRRHQLRLHLKTIGHPILGDATYHSRPRPTARMFLHAWRLKLPIRDEPVIEAESPMRDENDYSKFLVGIEGPCALAELLERGLEDISRFQI